MTDPAAHSEPLPGFGAAYCESQLAQARYLHRKPAYKRNSGSRASQLTGKCCTEKDKKQEIRTKASKKTKSTNSNQDQVRQGQVNQDQVNQDQGNQGEQGPSTKDKIQQQQQLKINNEANKKLFKGGGQYKIQKIQKKNVLIVRLLPTAKIGLTTTSGKIYF